jgi:hypothetical protein
MLSDFPTIYFVNISDGFSVKLNEVVVVILRTLCSFSAKEGVSRTGAFYFTRVSKKSRGKFDVYYLFLWTLRDRRGRAGEFNRDFFDDSYGVWGG